MKLKKLLSAALAGAMMLTLPLSLPEGEKLFTLSAEAAGTTDITKYSYTVTPLLSPFNTYFFVKTDNPDPTSFRFADKSSKYGEDAYISVDEDSFYETLNIYADVSYSDISTGRVNGGYIFSGYNTDGGQLVLQKVEQGRYSWEKEYKDTSKKITVAALKNNIDYLIDTYATKADFFENMDAVQAGFSSICLYSSSYIRGELYKSLEHWGLSTSPHADQSYYIQSPYRRNDNESLFAGALYPFKYDSLGFPGMLSSIAKQLNSNVTIEWDSYSHAHFTATLNGVSKQYGGQGNGKGQAITKDKINHYFTFGGDDLKMTLASARQRLDEYSKLEIESDIPEEGRLHWEDVYNTVGDGTWVRLISINGILGATSTTFSYLYKSGDGTDFWAEDAGNNGSEIYWGGDIGYYSSAWVDGRYIDSRERWEIGAAFEDHPTDPVVFTNMSIPVISVDIDWKYDYTLKEWKKNYKNVSVKEENRNVRFSYVSETDSWEVNPSSFNADPERMIISISIVEELVEQGLVAKSVLDCFTLTNDEMKAIKPDRNSCLIPKEGYIYDRSAAPGTPYKYLYGDVNLDGAVDLNDYSDLAKYLAEWEDYEYVGYFGLGDLDQNGVIDLNDLSLLGKCLSEWDGYQETYIV
ncbi:MAG: dockerin type I repeat-containing protein [Ruminococcus sp.]|nr:dockerin type I repeat-containing protein [Ruminococcus sp.]